MKKLFLFIAIVFSGMLMQAQDECTDIIYPADGGSIIFNCCITDVSQGNIVSYTKDSISGIIVAVAISKDGQYVDLKKYKSSLDSKAETVNEPDGLYRGHNYDYYSKQYNRASSRQVFGAFLTVFGLGLEIGGLVMANRSSSNNRAATNLYIAGAISFTIGFPLLISGGAKKANNKRAMEECKRNANLSLGATNNGLGLVLNF